MILHLILRWFYWSIGTQVSCIRSSFICSSPLNYTIYVCIDLRYYFATRSARLRTPLPLGHFSIVVYQVLVYCMASAFKCYSRINPFWNYFSLLLLFSEEEELLIRFYGEEYSSYMKRTFIGIPFVSTSALLVARGQKVEADWPPPVARCVIRVREMAISTL